jgi:hypothetical protein
MEEHIPMEVFFRGYIFTGGLGKTNHTVKTARKSRRKTKEKQKENRRTEGKQKKSKRKGDTYEHCNYRRT